MNVDFLEQLNDAQKDAVVNIDGPSMVLAGAGSGKTRVLTYRIAYLLAQGVKPYNVIALTFTNKAAREMKERIVNLVGNHESSGIWMGTFHSVFSKILRREAEIINYTRDYTIYDTEDSVSLIKKILNDFKLDPKEYKPSFVLSRISAAKMNLIDPDAYIKDASIQGVDREMRKPLIGQIYREYWHRCRRSSAMDFDDILYNTCILFRNNVEVLNKYQSIFKYILVDEYQDTNFVQYAILRMLSALNKNICVVGDDAQSIYAFRGANIENILNFSKDYNHCVTYKLEQNYRSTKNIVNAANNVITYNKKRLDKDVWTNNPEGEKINVVMTSSDAEEAMLIADSIFRAITQEQLDNKDIAVLYRTNAQSRMIEEAMRKNNIRYKIFGGKSFYQRAEVKNLIAYFRLVVNPSDNEALSRIINYPSRKIGETTVNKIATIANENQISYWEVIENCANYSILSSVASKLGDFYYLIKKFQTQQDTVDAYDLAQKIAIESGVVKNLYEDKSPEGVSRYQNIESVLNGVKIFQDEFVFENEEGVSPRLGDFLQSVSLLTDADEEQEDGSDNYVSLMTVHAAKGLEFPFVLIAGMEEGIFPSSMSSKSSKELEEERRLFYVAITRAKMKLSIFYAESRYRWGELCFFESSRFIDELSEEYVNNVGHFQAKQKSIPSLNIKSKESKNSIASKTPSYSFQKKSASSSSTVPVKDKKYSFAELIKPADVVEGMKVEHSRFGIGEVVMVDGSGDGKKAMVVFDDCGAKQLVLKYANLKLVKE